MRRSSHRRSRGLAKTDVRRGTSGCRRATGPRSDGLLLLIALLLVGCAGAPLAAVRPGPFEPLAADEGYLVVQIGTSLAIREVEAGGLVIARDLQPGEHLWLTRVKAGRYRFSSVRLGSVGQGSPVLRPKSFGVWNQREFDFDVKAGEVNYPGHLLVRFYDRRLGAGAGIAVRNRNHSAMAIRALSKTHPELIAAHPLRYAGYSGDQFLEFYTRERDRLKKSGDAKAEARAREGGTR